MPDHYIWTNELRCQLMIQDFATLTPESFYYQGNRLRRFLYLFEYCDVNYKEWIPSTFESAVQAKNQDAVIAILKNAPRFKTSLLQNEEDEENFALENGGEIMKILTTCSPGNCCQDHGGQRFNLMKELMTQNELNFPLNGEIIEPECPQMRDFLHEWIKHQES